MDIPLQIKEFLLKNFGAADLSEFRTVGGGSINQCFSFRYAKNKFFVKVNAAAKYPGMFKAEASGLELLMHAKAFCVPQPLLSGEENNIQFLLLNFIERSAVNESFSISAGRLLAIQHKTQSDHFGLEHDNYIGSLPQKNLLHRNGIEFIIHCRFLPQLEWATNKGYLNAEERILTEKLLHKLHLLIPEEKASLLHGDLWSGNIFNSVKGPFIFDPAVYYGHRENDIAMTYLFGGFDAAFYEAYNELYPLQHQWQERTELFQLYPLLVHLNLFGQSYKPQIMQIVQKYL